MRIIIGGAGEVGTHLARILSNENHDIVVIDTDEDKLRLIDSSLDVMAMVGSATSIELLEESGLSYLPGKDSFTRDSWFTSTDRYHRIH